MSVRRSVITAAIVLAVLLIGIWRAGPSSEDPAYVESAPESEPLQIEIVKRETELGQENPRFLVESDTDPLEGLVGEGLNRMGGSVEQDLSIVDDVLMAWQTNFVGTGNPVGLNSEIMAALNGRNRLRLELIPSDHPAINDAGELCDRWGTPLIFHQVSGHHMELRSAGPDGVTYSDDDVVLNAFYATE